MPASVASTSLSASRPRRRSGVRRSSERSPETGAPATVAVIRPSPRGSGLSVDRWLSSSAMASARHVCTGVRVRSSRDTAPPASVRRVRVMSLAPSRAGRASRSAMFSSPRSERTMRARTPARAASWMTVRPRSSAMGSKRTSSRSISARGGPGARSARRKPAMWRRPRAEVEVQPLDRRVPAGEHAELAEREPAREAGLRVPGGAGRDDQEGQEAQGAADPPATSAHTVQDALTAPRARGHPVRAWRPGSAGNGSPVREPGVTSGADRRAGGPPWGSASG